MKKLFSYLLVGSLIVLAAWLANAPRPAQADVPAKYHDTVRKGLEYLVKQQHADGHWEGDGGQHPVAMTGLVGLAFVMAAEHPMRNRGGETPAPVAKYPAQLRKAADWLMAQSQGERDGLLFSGHPSETTRYMEGHGLATLFLASVLEDERDLTRHHNLSDVVGRAVRYIRKASSSRGGWYHTSKREGHDFDDVLVTAIQVQALRAAEYAGVLVATGSIEDAKEYLKSMVARHAREKPAQSIGQTTEIAAALAACYGTRPNNQWPIGKSLDKVLTSWLQRCETEIPRGPALQFGRDELAHYYYAQALFTLRYDVEPWNKYRTAMFDHLQKTQDADGGWPAANGLGVGQVYATALWCTLLQHDRRSHPLTRIEILDID
jgi:hypothetical protein